MKEEELYIAIEKINREKYELKTSRAYKLGNALLLYLNILRKMDFKSLYKNLKDKKAAAKIRKYYVTKTEQSAAKDNHVDYTTSRIAVYTCILGEYDDIQIPLVTFDNVDFFIITDKPEKYESFKEIYTILKLPDEVLKEGNILANRYAKFHPSEFFEDYDYAIYMDGNVRVISDVRQFVKKCNKVTGIAMHVHRERDCIYAEAAVCKYLRRGIAEFVEKQILEYQKTGFPEHFGMNEATVIVSDLKNVEACRLLDDWWKELLRSKSMRDQLAWPYIVWKNQYRMNDIGNLGNDIYQNFKLELGKHI